MHNSPWNVYKSISVQCFIVSYYLGDVGGFQQTTPSMWWDGFVLVKRVGLEELNRITTFVAAVFEPPFLSIGPSIHALRGLILLSCKEKRLLVVVPCR